MPKRRKPRDRAKPSTTSYSDPEGNELVLRDSLSAGTLRKLSRSQTGPAGTTEDEWHRRGELLFERLTVSWTIAGLPLTAQRDLLGRYRMASTEERGWVRDTLERHLDGISSHSG